MKKSDYTYSNTNQLLKLVERMFDENNKEIARKTTKYSYDSNGNQLKQGISHTLPDNTGLRPKTTGSAYGDNVSSAIDKLVEKTSYTYDGFNRLKKTETVKAGIRTTVDFTYNGDDLRVSKTVKKSDKGYQAEVTSYLYDRQNVILETDASNNIKARYVKGINYIAKADAAGKESYFLYNGHGDVIQTVDAAGTIQNQYDYDIWGNPTLTVETTDNAIRYTGEFYDEETGLYYLRARYYDPYLGRFTTEDSYWGEDGNPLSLNLYTYCMNDPIQYTDPTGHLSEWDKQNLSKEQQKQVEQSGKAYYEALAKGDRAGMEKAHNDAEAVRNQNRNENEYGTADGNTVTRPSSGSGSSSSSGSKSSSSSGSSSSTVVLVDPLVGVIFDVDSSEADYWLNSGCVRLDDGGEFVFGNITNTSNHVDKINIAAGGNVTITNQKNREIRAINAGENSNITINNRGIIDTIIAEKGSSVVLNNYGTVKNVNIDENASAIINNYNEISIIKAEAVTKGNDLGMYIFNFGRIDKIYTGENSKNLIINFGHINYLKTGKGNSTNVEGIDIKEIVRGIDSTVEKNGKLTEGQLRKLEVILNANSKNDFVSNIQLNLLISALNSSGNVEVKLDLKTGKYVVKNKGTGNSDVWIPNEMKLNGSSAQEKYLKSALANLGIKWDQAKVDALWKAVEEINKQYSVQMDPRFLLAIIIHEGTGSFNTSSANKAADGQNGVESNYARDLMKAESLVFGKILGFIYYGDDFKKAVEENKNKSGISGSGDIFQFTNWSTPIIGLNSKKVYSGEYAGDGAWHDGVRDIYEKLTYSGAASDYSNYLTNVDSSVVKNIAQGINLPSFSFIASKNGQDYRGRPNGKWTIIGKSK